jgi:hypothetical protein
VRDFSVDAVRGVYLGWAIAVALFVYAIVGECLLCFKVAVVSPVVFTGAATVVIILDSATSG